MCKSIIFVSANEIIEDRQGRGLSVDPARFFFRLAQGKEILSLMH